MNIRRRGPGSDEKKEKGMRFAHLHPDVRILFVPDFRLLNSTASLLDFPGSPESRGAH